MRFVRICDWLRGWLGGDVVEREGRGGKEGGGTIWDCEEEVIGGLDVGCLLRYRG